MVIEVEEVLSLYLSLSVATLNGSSSSALYPLTLCESSGGSPFSWLKCPLSPLLLLSMAQRVHGGWFLLALDPGQGTPPSILNQQAVQFTNSMLLAPAPAPVLVPGQALGHGRRKQATSKRYQASAHSTCSRLWPLAAWPETHWTTI
jgi:hypothetical protein